MSICEKFINKVSTELNYASINVKTMLYFRKTMDFILIKS
jgi:hypothetical protein